MDHPARATPSKMLYYKKHFMHFSELGFIMRPKYLDVFLLLEARPSMMKIRRHSVEKKHLRIGENPTE